MVKSAQALAGLIVCRDTTGALSTPTVGPTGTLYVDGVSNAASVTITGTNPYKWAVTLPTLTVGQSVQVYITATIATIATAAIVFEDIGDTALASDNAATLGAAGAGLTSIPNSAGVTSLLTALVPVVGAQVNDAGASTTVFITNLASAVTDFYKGMAVVFTSGALAGQLGQVKTYNGSTKAVTVQSPLTSAPANNVYFDVVSVAASRKFSDFLGALDATGRSNVGLWLDNVPAGLTATGKFLQVALERWLTDDAAGTPAALSASGKFLQVMLEKWLTDDAAGTPLALTAVNLVQADAIKEAGAVPNNLAQTQIISDAVPFVGANIGSILTAVNNLNNLSALANLFAPSQLVRPASGSIAYPFTFIVKDSEGHPVDVDTNTVTLTAKNAAGTDRSANLSAVTHSGTGEYTFTYTVHSIDADEGLAVTASGTVQSAVRKAYANGDISDAESLAALADIQARLPAALTVAGNLKVDVEEWRATVPDILSSGKIPSDVKLWLTSAPDALSSGKIPADVKLWLASAPAILTTNGFVQTTVMRWLTDNAAGTPLSLTAAWLLQVNAVVGGATPQQIWDALLTALTTPGSIGKLLADDIDAKVTSRSTLTAQQVWDALLTVLTTPGSIGELLSQFVFTIPGQVDANAITGGSGLTAQQVWDELLMNMTMPNSAGELLANIISLMNTALSLAHGAGLWGGAMGTGSMLYVPDRATDPAHNPLDGVYTWATTDLANPAIGIKAAGYTDNFGMITPGFMLDPGLYAIWRQLGGYVFPMPELVTV